MLESLQMSSFNALFQVKDLRAMFYSVPDHSEDSDPADW